MLIAEIRDGQGQNDQPRVSGRKTGRCWEPAATACLMVRWGEHPQLVLVSLGEMGKAPAATFSACISIETMPLAGACVEVSCPWARSSGSVSWIQSVDYIGQDPFGNTPVAWKGWVKLGRKRTLFPWKRMMKIKTGHWVILGIYFLSVSISNFKTHFSI